MFSWWTVKNLLTLALPLPCAVFLSILMHRVCCVRVPGLTGHKSSVAGHLRRLVPKQCRPFYIWKPVPWMLAYFYLKVFWAPLYYFEIFLSVAFRAHLTAVCYLCIILTNLVMIGQWARARATHHEWQEHREAGKDAHLMLQNSPKVCSLLYLWRDLSHNY